MQSVQCTRHIADPFNCVTAYLRRAFLLLLALALTACGDSVTSEDGADTVNADPGGPTLEANTPPTISGTPALELREGDFYVFMPNASDEDGDNLYFTVYNRPAWTTFDPASGSLYGTPGAEDVGTTSPIIITVHDGTTYTELTAFTITVTDLQSEFGSVVLSWLPPTENEDGSTLTDLNAYRIYYGTSPDDLDQVVTIDNPGISSFVIENLELVSHYFAASAINSEGVESERSNVVEIIPT